MPRRQKKYHYIYKTVCVVTNRYYIGMHSTDNLDDGYVGSGKRLWYSINKYGKDNHIVEILEYLENRKELKEREKEIINSDLILNEMCMNLALGGQGGYISKEQAQAGGRKTWKKNLEAFYNKLKDPIYKEKHCKKISNGLKDKWKKGDHNWSGKKHTEETKKKIGEKNSVHQKGKGNSQYGKCWIHHLELKESMIIIKKDLDSYLKLGWILGRKMKF